MEYELILRWFHVLGACVLIGTGAGIAFFMLMAHRTREAVVIAQVAQMVVVADFCLPRQPLFCSQSQAFCLPLKLAGRWPRVG